MSLRKRCDEQSKLNPDGSPNPLYCPNSPRCDHHWHFDFRVNRRRYRGTTETADKGRRTPPKPVKPATVNRELDTLRAICSKAVEWRKLVANPCESVRRLKVDNRRTRILTEDERTRLLAAAPRKTRAVIALALLTGARIGELLELTWANVGANVLTFLHTKNGKERRIDLTPDIQVILDALPKSGAFVFMNARTEERYTSNGVRHVFRRAVIRAGIENPGEVTPHTLRHTALRPDDRRRPQRPYRHGIEWP